MSGATSLDLSAIKTDVTDNAAAFRSLVGLAPVVSSGSTILFDSPLGRIYNAASPSSSATVTLDFTGAIPGASVVFVSDGTEVEIISAADVYQNGDQVIASQGSLFLLWDGSQVYASWVPSAISGGGVSGSLFIDTHPGVTTAWSLRQMRSGYTGSAIRVRRSTDDAEQDIGFVDGELDTAELNTFCGAGDGFVKTWYDQSVNGVNATQATSGSQPKIVDSGLVQTDNGKPCVVFSSSLLQCARLLSENAWAIFCVCNKQGAGFQSLVNQHTGINIIGRTAPMQFADAAFQLFFNNGSSRSGSHSESVSNEQLIAGSFAFDDDYYLSKNSDLETIISSQSLTPLNTDFSIGALGNGSNPFSGKIQELVVYNSDQLDNRTDIESDLNDFYGVYL